MVFAAGDERLCLQHMTGLRQNSHSAEKAALNVCEWRYVWSYLTPSKHRRGNGTGEINQALVHARRWTGPRDEQNSIVGESRMYCTGVFTILSRSGG